MIHQFLTNKNILILTSVSIVFSLVIIGYFVNLTINEYSFLQLTNSGNVIRTVNHHHLFRSSLINTVICIVFFIILFAVAIFILLSLKNLNGDSSISNDQKIEDNLSAENAVFYGKGKISDATVKSFVRQHPESAIKFIFEKNIDGSLLDPLIKKLHRDWIIRGMSTDIVKNEILSLLELDEIPDRNLYELTIELRNKAEQNNPDIKPQIEVEINDDKNLVEQNDINLIDAK